ncbi:MAG TPA: carbon monoxide dehydrogenase beta subunit family protein [Nitrospiria bacterium]
MYLKREYLYDHDQPYKVLPGPEGYINPAAAAMGVELPDPGDGLLYGAKAPEDQVMEEIARKLLTAENPTLHVGPQIIWAWNELAVEKARAVIMLAAEIPDLLVIPMADYRPRYPKVDPEEMINPNHPNLTIWHNKEGACIFVGVHCHYANLTLKMIRAGTDCCTIALCAEQGHEDANLTVRDSDAKKIWKMAGVIKKVREEMKIPKPTVPPTGGYGPEDGKRIIHYTAEEWNQLVESARTGEGFVGTAPPVGVPPELGRPEGAL